MVFKGDLEVDMEVDSEVDLEGKMEGDFKGDFRGDFKQDMEGNLLSTQVRSRSGLVKVWLRLQLKLKSLELDSEVGRLVFSL